MYFVIPVLPIYSIVLYLITSQTNFYLPWTLFRMEDHKFEIITTVDIRNLIDNKIKTIL